MGRLITDVQQGSFDYALTKPVDVQLLVSVSEFRIWKLTDVIVGGSVLSTRPRSIRGGRASC